MIKNILLCIITIYSTSCDNSLNKVRTDITTYEIEVASELGLSLEDLFINVEINNDLEATSKNGICRISNKRGVLIKIRKKFWESASDSAKTALLAHEMLHCYFGFDHIESTVNSRGKLMGIYTTDSTRCVENLGLSRCIEESFELFKEGKIKSVFK
jgi:hypothetical protein